MQKNVFVPELEDGVPDPTAMTDANIAYSIRSIMLQRELLSVLEAVQAIEQDGCYIGEHGGEGRIKMRIDNLSELFDAIVISGREMSRERSISG